MEKIELLVPAKNFECLKKAVECGADCIYLGAKKFNCRTANNQNNFTINELIRAINYCKERKVKTYLTLNTLIKDEEFEEAINLADIAYKNGIDAIIVQDLGLGKELIKRYPKMDIHASTQTTITNRQGIKFIEKMGFKRAIVSRELSMSQIESICKNSNIEIETFIHGGLCISYSGQCLFSSINYGLAGNRGMCVGSCRDNFLLKQNDSIIDSGKLLKPKDLLGLEYIPKLINAGVKCLKVQGRTRSIGYIEEVTKIYRKYIDLAYSNNQYVIAEEDIKKLESVSTRGLSTAHFGEESNKNYIVENNIKKYDEENQSKKKINYSKIQLKNATYKNNDISILLSNIKENYNYEKLAKSINRVYIPIKEFNSSVNEKIIKLCKRYNVYIYMPLVILEKDIEEYKKILNNILNKYRITGFVLSNYSDLSLIEEYGEKYKYISNYTFNIFNINSCNILKELQVDVVTTSIELSNEESNKISKSFKGQVERIIYGRPPLMNIKYSLVNKETISSKKIHGEYQLKDLQTDGEFEIENNNNDSILTKIYSKKIISIGDTYKNNSLRLDFRDESIEEINNVIEKIQNGKFYYGDLYFNDILVK